MSLRILIVGPLPPPVGGTTVSLAALVRALQDLGVAVHVVDSAVRVAPFGQFRTLLRAMLQVVRMASKVDIISCHMSVRGALTAGPIFRIIAWVVRKPFVHRQFGGGLTDVYRRLPAPVRWFIRKTLFSSDLVLFQTHQLVRELGPHCTRRVEWFPTARKDAGCRYEARFARRAREILRCIFVSQVRAEKGVFEAISAIGKVEDAELHIYGPLVGIREEQLVAPRVFYHGELPPEDVQPNLAVADLLLFPTYHTGEGYPGVLVEAAFVGLPVVATRWQAIPEMFPRDELILVEPRSAAQIADALRRVVNREIDLSSLSAKMRERSSQFDAPQVFGRFAAVCAELSSTSKGRRRTPSIHRASRAIDE